MSEPDAGQIGEEFVREVALFGGVACQARRPADAVVDVLRAGVEQVVLASMGIELTWWTTAVTPDDDLMGPTTTVTKPGLDWEHVRSRQGTLESVTLTARATALLDHRSHPKNKVVTLDASFPTFAQWAGRDVSGLTVGLSMHRWAMYGSGVDLGRVVEPLSRWLLDAADTLDADTGYLTLDRVDAIDGQSPWEEVVGFSPGYRDLTSTVWGYGWGTLLSSRHVTALGGVATLKSLSWAHVEERTGGRVWLTLREDIARTDRDTVIALRELLAPVLPAGSMTLDEYVNGPPEPYSIRRQYIL